VNDAPRLVPIAYFEGGTSALTIPHEAIARAEQAIAAERLVVGEHVAKVGGRLSVRGRRRLGGRKARPPNLAVCRRKRCWRAAYFQRRAVGAFAEGGDMSERASTIVGTFPGGVDYLIVPNEALARASAILDEQRRQREAEAAAEAKAAIERASKRGWRDRLRAFFGRGRKP
jgi:hypothetical protein